MSLYIDLKYTNLLSSRLDKFVTKGEYLFNFRCPICGDSQTNLSKKRGFIFRRANNLLFKCHNCTQSMSFGNLLKHIDQTLFNQYILERYKDGESGFSNFKQPTFNVPVPKFGRIDKRVTYDNAEWCDLLPEQHFAKLYLKSRKLPDHVFSKLLFTQNYQAFADEVYPLHGKELSADARIVIPFFDNNGVLIAISGRALENASERLRYITFRINDSEEKLLFGLDRVDTSKPVYIVEGQFDSFFIDNCIAATNSDLEGASKKIKEQGDIKTILVYDNEKRNKEIVKLMGKAIKNDNNIVIWPETTDGKDINDMIINGLTTGEIKDTIDKNTTSGLEALTKFTYWKKS